MRRLLIALTIVTLLVVPQFALGGDADALKTSFENFVKAFNSFDHATIGQMIYPGHVAFTTDGPFPSITPGELSKRGEGIREWFKTLESLRITLVQPEYKVIGDTGIMWGYETADIKKKDGPAYTVHSRVIHTFIKVDGKWKVLTTHMSLIPTKSD